MRKLKYNIWIILFLTALMAKAQEYEKPVQEFNVKKGATIKIKASYQEIEIEEWNKNKVSIQGVFRTIAAARHTATTKSTARFIRPLPIEIRICHCFIGFAKKYGNISGFKLIFLIHLLGKPLQTYISII